MSIDASHITAKESVKMGFGQRGLTMVEALVTLGVASLLLTVGLPPLTAFLEESRLRSDSTELYTALFMARSEAITRNKRVALCKIDPANLVTCDNAESWESGWIAFVDEDEDTVRDAGEDIIVTHTGMSDETAVSSAAFANTISYLPSGSSSNNGQFTICVSEAIAKTILINATGRPRMADGSCS